MTPPYGRKRRGTKEPLDECEDESEKACLKCHIQKTKIMASGPILSGQIDVEAMETVIDFIFLGSRIMAADGKYCHEIKRSLLLGIIVMANLDNILKSKDIILPTKICLVKTMVFPVLMYGCESWTIKKEQTFGLCGGRQGWDVSREQHRNMYIIKGETDYQPRLDA